MVWTLEEWISRRWLLNSVKGKQILLTCYDIRYSLILFWVSNDEDDDEGVEGDSDDEENLADLAPSSA